MNQHVKRRSQETATSSNPGGALTMAILRQVITTCNGVLMHMHAPKPKFTCRQSDRSIGHACIEGTLCKLHMHACTSANNLSFSKFIPKGQGFIKSTVHTTVLFGKRRVMREALCSAMRMASPVHCQSKNHAMGISSRRECSANRQEPSYQEGYAVPDACR